MVHCWTSRTHAIDYTIRSTEELYRVSTTNPDPNPCLLLQATTPQGQPLLRIPCFSCSGCGSPEQYLKHYQRQLFSSLRIRFPSVPRCCTAELANTFKYAIERAHSTHNCPHLHRVKFNSTHSVEIRIQLSLAWVINRAIEESEEEAARLHGTRPATKDSVRGLLKAKMEEEGDGGWKSCECVICMEEIETRRDSLRMPCSHVFHEACLVQWLDNSHACPLCRYEMPQVEKI